MELLVILAIVAILSIGGALALNGRQNGAVRALLDELEGSIANAHQAAVASGRDTAIVCWGGWDKDDPMRIAFGDAKILALGGGQASFIKIAESILEGGPPTSATPVLAETEVPAMDQQTVAVAFHYSPKDPVQRKACVVADGASGWEDAKGRSDDISAVPPFSADLSGVLDAANNLCRGGGGVSQVCINGYTKRFTRTVFIKVVAADPGGRAMENGPMGLIALLENSASIFRFYNPGSENGDGKWRRI